MIKGFLISWQNNENMYESNFKEILTSIKYLEVHMHVHEYSDMQSLTVYPEVSFLKAKKYIDLKSFRGQKMTPPPIIEISQQDVESPPPPNCVFLGRLDVWENRSSSFPTVCTIYRSCQKLQSCRSRLRARPASCIHSKYDVMYFLFGIINENYISLYEIW